MPTKGELLLTAVSIVNWIAGCVSFRTERKSVAAARYGRRIFCRNREACACASFSSMEHIKVLAISGPNGELIATPSICLNKPLLNWKSRSLAEIVSSPIRSPSYMLRLCVL